MSPTAEASPLRATLPWTPLDVPWSLDMSHNNIKIRPRNNGPDFDNMSALCCIQSHGPDRPPSPRQSSRECAARVCSRVTHMATLEAPGKVEDAGVAALRFWTCQCRRYPGEPGFVQVDIACECRHRSPLLCPLMVGGADRWFLWSAHCIHNEALGGTGWDERGFFVSRQSARPVRERMCVGGM